MIQTEVKELIQTIEIPEWDLQLYRVSIHGSLAYYDIYLWRTKDKSKSRYLRENLYAIADMFRYLEESCMET